MITRLLNWARRLTCHHTRDQINRFKSGRWYLECLRCGHCTRGIQTGEM